MKKMYEAEIAALKDTITILNRVTHMLIIEIKHPPDKRVRVAFKQSGNHPVPEKNS